MTREEERMISDILKILSIRSFTHDEKGIAKCQEFLIDIAKKMGFKASLCGNRRVVVIEPQTRTGKAKIGLVVHIDTVPYDEKNWKHNPLGEISNSIIYGRGIVDDKGPTILALHAMYNLTHEIGDSWQIIVGSSEEDEWVDMEEFLAEKPDLPAFLATLDGDGVLNGCRGNADVSLTFKKETKTNFVTDFVVPNGMKHTVPAKCIAIVNGKQMIGKGKEVHSSIPECGHSAITDLAKKITLNDKGAYQEYRKMFDFLSKLDMCSDESIFEQQVMKDANGVGTSISATTAQMEGNLIKVNLNVRLGPGRNKEDVHYITQYLNQKYGCDVQVTECIEPSLICSNQKEFVAMCSAYERVIGKKPNVSIAKGIGYNAALPNCAIFGPRFDIEHDDEPDTCHMADECRSIGNFLKFYEVLKIFLKEVL